MSHLRMCALFQPSECWVTDEVTTVYNKSEWGGVVYSLNMIKLTGCEGVYLYSITSTPQHSFSVYENIIIQERRAQLLQHNK